MTVVWESSNVFPHTSCRITNRLSDMSLKIAQCNTLCKWGLLNVQSGFCLTFLIHINRQWRHPEMWRETIFAFDSTLSIMVFEEGENAYFTFKVVIGDQRLQVNHTSCFSVAQTFVVSCSVGMSNISAAWLWNEGSATNRIMFKKMVQTLH